MNQQSYLVRPKTEDQLLTLTKECSIYEDPRELNALPSAVRQAVQFGFVTLGFDYIDYLREAVRGKPITPDPDGPRKKGFVETLYWQEQGTGKSSLSWQHQYMLEAGDPEARGPDFDEDKVWEYTLKRKIMEEEALHDLYKEISVLGPFNPIPHVDVDDVTTSIPKHLWFTKGGIKKFSNLHQFIAVIRPYVKVLSFSSPFPENLVSLLTENLKMEIIVYPNNTYMVERYVRLANSKRSASSILKKIVVEYSTFKLNAIPSEWWARYEEKRFAITQKVAKELEQSEKRPMPEVLDLMRDYLRKTLDQDRVQDTMGELRQNGYHFTSSTVEAALKLQRQKLVQKFGLQLDNSDIKKIPDKYEFKPPELSEEDRIAWTRALQADSKKARN